MPTTRTFNPLGHKAFMVDKRILYPQFTDSASHEEKDIHKAIAGSAGLKQSFPLHGWRLAVRVIQAGRETTVWTPRTPQTSPVLPIDLDFPLGLSDGEAKCIPLDAVTMQRQGDHEGGGGKADMARTCQYVR
jgi:hypothetical protein